MTINSVGGSRDLLYARKSLVGRVIERAVAG
jgi:hypothetical protein